MLQASTNQLTPKDQLKRIESEVIHQLNRQYPALKITHNDESLNPNDFKIKITTPDDKTLTMNMSYIPRVSKYNLQIIDIYGNFKSFPLKPDNPTESTLNSEWLINIAEYLINGQAYYNIQLKLGDLIAKQRYYDIY